MWKHLGKTKCEPKRSAAVGPNDVSYPQSYRAGQLPDPFKTALVVSIQDDDGSDCASLAHHLDLRTGSQPVESRRRAGTGSYGQIVSRCRQRPSSLPSSVVAGDRDGAGRTVDNDGVTLVDDASGISNHDNCW